MAVLRPSNLALIEKALLAIELPDGVELYDFGGGNIVAPVPDIGMTSYLTDHMSAIARKRETTFDPIIITGFKYDMQFVTPAQLQREALRAAQYNLAQTKQFEIIPKEPK